MLQAKSYLVRPHRHGHHHAGLHATDGAAGDCFPRSGDTGYSRDCTSSLTPDTSQYPPITLGEAKASGSGSRTLSSREPQQSSQPYCNFPSTCPLCSARAHGGLLSAGPRLQVFPPPLPHPAPKRSFLVMGHLPGPYCSSADRGTSSDSIGTGQWTHPNPPLGSFHSSSTGAVRPPAHLYSSLAFSSHPTGPTPVAISCFFLP